MNDLTALDHLTRAIDLIEAQPHNLDTQELMETISAMFDPSVGGCEPSGTLDIAISIQDTLNFDLGTVGQSFTWLALNQALDNLAKTVLNYDRATCEYSWRG